MARHRLVKQLDLDAELDDYDGVDDYEAEFGNSVIDLADEDQESLQKGLVDVKDLIGTEIKITDQEIRDTLWHYYFDVPKSVTWILDQNAQKMSKKAKAKAKNDTSKATSLKNGASRQAEHATCIKPFDAAEFFKDSPWLNIPKERRSHIIIEPLHPPGRLLGGAPPKQSKLAALAAARRKKDEQSKAEKAILSVSQNESPNVPTSLREKLAARPVRGPASKVSTPENQDPFKEPEKAVEEVEKQASPDPPPKPKPTPTMFRKSLSQTQARPSSFAMAMFPKSSSAIDLTTAEDLFTLPYRTSTAKVFAFTDPSPDDVVSAAQSARGAKNKDASSVAESLKNVTLESAPKVKSKNLDVLKEYSKTEHKNAANFVVIGHVDAGKSTLMGRLLFDLKAVNARTIEKYQKEASTMGKKSFALAWVLDEGSEERDRGVTIDIATNGFETERTKFTILDAPGHRDFIPNMIAGASQADFAVLVLDASPNSFESGLRGQTKEHALLVRSMGIQRLIVAINKLDTVQWAQSRFTEISQQTSAFLSSAGFALSNTTFIPCSGLHGHNITSSSPPELTSWHHGPTLLAALESAAEPTSTQSLISAPLRLPITDVFRGNLHNPLSVSGRLESGSLQTGDSLLVLPAREPASVRAIEIDHETRDWAVAGANVTLHLADIEAAHLRTGDVICSYSGSADASSLPPVVKKLVVKILAFEHVLPSMVEVLRGRLNVPGKVKTLLATLDKASGAVVKKKPRIVAPGAVARVVVELERGVVMEKGARVVLRAEGETLAAGLVE